ncbi:MAG: DUF177 domain-containing protein [Peptococcaceae bacterium]|nr:DUF177 domain-containing protein [Peptococcaceae bacterium]
MALFVDLSSLRQNPGRREHVSLQSDRIDGLEEGLTLRGPVKLEADLVGEDRKVALNGRVQAVIDTACDRCLAPVSYTLDFPLEETLISSHDVAVLAAHGADQEELENSSWIYDDVHLDLNYLVLDAIINQLPPQHLCREDCKGLCPHCGANLNNGPCDCNHTETDPRWAILAQLKDDKE